MVRLFGYRSGSSFLHKCDARIKLISLFVLGTFVFLLPRNAALACIVLFFMLSPAIRFPMKEILSSLKPLVYYALILYSSSIVSALFAHAPFPLPFIPSERDIVILCRLALAFLIANAVYRTTSPLELREAVESIERGVVRIFRQRAEYRRLLFSESLSLLIVLIPEVFAVWQAVFRAWKARRGKKGIRMVLTLFPVFISVCMKRTYIMSLALKARKLQKIDNG